MFLALFGGMNVAAFSQSSAPEIPFDFQSPLQMPPDLYLGEVAGIALNSKHHVFVFTRTGSDHGTSLLDGRAARLFEFGPDGKFVKEIGKNLYSMAWAHAVRVDKDDNIWLVDQGSDEVVELSPDYKVKLILGRRDEAREERGRPQARRAPDTRPGWFYQPTDVAFDAQGNIFVSDGYGNSEVHKFDKDGHILKATGTADKGSGPGQFNLPHSIAVDARGLVYVADRGNHRIEVLDNDLNYVREIRFDLPIPAGYVSNVPDFGRDETTGTYSTLWPNTLCISPGRTQYIYVNSMVPGKVYKFTLEGKLVGQFGASGHRPGQFGWIHGLACVSENEIWTGELLTWRAQKITLHPAKTTDERTER